MKSIIIGHICFIFFGMSVSGADFKKDIFETSDGELTITFIAHGTLMMEFNGKVIHVDPVGSYADYSKLPKADIILVTHEHGDHLDVNAIDILRKEPSVVIETQKCAGKYKDGIVLNNGDSLTYEEIEINAVPAYNIKHMRSPENPYHPKGVGNGYVIHFGNKKVYVAGDTENIPEMGRLKNIDIAFLPMNLPYTMTPEMVADAAEMFHPKILYPYHYGNTDTGKLLNLMKNQNETEVRIRNLK